MTEILEKIRSGDFRALFLEPTRNGLLQFLRYAFVGGIATLVDWATLYTLTELGIYYILSAVFGFFTGLTANFALSKLLVFRANEARVGNSLEFLAYALIGAAGLLLTLGIMYVFTEVLHLWYMASKAVATLIVLAWNYGARRKLVYR